MMAALLEVAVNSIQLMLDLSLNPAITLSAIAFLKYGPSHLVAKITASELIRRYVGLGTLHSSLKVLLGLGLARSLSKLQNLRASNNWKLRGHQGWHWDEEIAVVTGGCNGIGKATVLGLLHKGVRVAILDVADLPSDLAHHKTLFYYNCDITSPQAVREAADKIREELGHPSILINNAGLINRDSILDSRPEKVSKLFDVNVLSHWYTVKEFLPVMVLRNKGHIVTVASLASFVTLPTTVEYSASKAAVLSFHEGLASEIRNIYKAPGIITTVVHPIFVNTDMTSKSKEQIEGKSGQMLEPEDISGAILKQIYSCRGAQLVIPSRLSWLSGFRGLPNWFQEIVRDAVSHS